jgi:hypothetical protein
MMFALPQQAPNAADAWRHYARFVELSPTPVRQFNEKKGLMYVAMALVRAQLPDSALAVATRGRAGADIDPLRELALLEAIPRSWAGDHATAADQFALYLAANAGQRDALRTAAQQNSLYWYLKELADQPRFRELIGLR